MWQECELRLGADAKLIDSLREHRLCPGFGVYAALATARSIGAARQEGGEDRAAFGGQSTDPLWAARSSRIASCRRMPTIEAVEAGERLGAVLVPLLGLIDHLVERDHLMLSILSKQKAQAQAQAQAAGQAAGDAAGVVTDPSMDPAPDIVTQAVRVVAALLSLPQALSRSRGSSMEGPGANRSLLTDNMSRGSGGGGLGVLRGSNSSGLIGSQRMGASDRYVGPSVLQC